MPLSFPPDAYVDIFTKPNKIVVFLDPTGCPSDKDFPAYVIAWVTREMLDKDLI